MNNLEHLSKEELIAMLRDNASLWLAHDGLWFQSIEAKHGMGEALEHDRNAWRLFSPLEAQRIKHRLILGENPGLEGLKIALQSRMYALINEYEIADETDISFVLRMTSCRVQSARNRKGLDYFPCKEVGLVEYSTFAKTIDSRIDCECVSCPPDRHPGAWYCSWRFIVR